MQLRWGVGEECITAHRRVLCPTSLRICTNTHLYEQAGLRFIPPCPAPPTPCVAKGNVSDAEHERTNSFIGTMEYMVGVSQFKTSWTGSFFKAG